VHRRRLGRQPQRRQDRRHHPWLACKAAGDVDALLRRREGLYSSHLASWRKQLQRHGEEGLARKRRGPPVSLFNNGQRNARGCSLWVVKETSIDQVGCIHTCQGLDLSYVGVLIGPDLVVRNGRVITRPEHRDQYDNTIKGWKKRSKEDPEGTEAITDAIIKNTYRTLMSRGMRGCYIFSDDPETLEHFA
jgi:hypothetical protein